MTKEQEEQAIKIIYEIIYEKDGTRAGYIDIDNFTDKTCEKFIIAIEMVLNMLKEKDKEIENQTEKRNNQKAELTILNEKQKEMNKLVNTVKSYKGMFKKLQKESKRKDNIIDLMTEQLAGLTIFDIEKDEADVLIDKKEVKQYFERKAEQC